MKHINLLNLQDGRAKKTMWTSKANNICKYGVTSMYQQVFLSEKLYEDEEVDLPIPIIYYSR